MAEKKRNLTGDITQKSYLKRVGGVEPEKPGSMSVDEYKALRDKLKKRKGK